MFRIEDTVSMQRKLVNGDGVENLSVSEVRFASRESNQVVKWNGRSYDITYLAVQEFVGEQGFVIPHQEQPGVIEMYFSLGSSVTVQLDNEKREMQNLNLTDDFFLAGRYTLVFDLFETNTPHLAVAVNTVKDGRVIGTEIRYYPAVVIQPGTTHGTSWEKKKNGNNPLFLAVKLKLIPPED